jgi:hypothetical protein
MGGMGAAFYVPALLELVDDGDHPTRGDVERVGEGLLGLAFVEGDEVEHREMACFEPERFEAGSEDRPACRGSEMSLRELQMYWKRIPDFGVTEYEIFTSEKGWTQILCWRGTGEDGAEYRGDEVDVVYTDDEFSVARVEIYSDAKQWSAIVAYANDKTIEELKDSPGYAELLADGSG